MRKRYVGGLIVVAILFIAGFFGVNYARNGQKVEQDISWLKDYRIAHRGLHDEESMENSMSSFEKAIKSNKTIELDVHLSKDGQVMVFHDEDLKRVTGLDKKLADCTVEELQQLKLGNTDETIPTLKEVLALVNGQVPLLIEIKNEGKVGALEETLYNDLKDYKGRYAIQAFNPFVLEWYKNNAPEVIRGQLSGSYADNGLAWYKKIVLRNLLLNFKSKPAFIAYEIDAMPKGFVKKQQDKGIITLGWTARDKESYDKALKYFDNVIYENVSVD